MISTTTKSSIPIIIKREPIIIIKPETHLNTQELSTEPETDANGESSQKKRKPTTLKRKIKEFSNKSASSVLEELPNTSIQSEEMGHQNTPVVELDELFIPDTNVMMDVICNYSDYPQRGNSCLH